MFSPLQRGAAFFGSSPLDFSAMQRMRERQAENIAMADRISNQAANSSRNARREGMSLAQVEAELQKLQRRRAALDSSPQHRSMLDVQATMQRIEATQEERYQAEHKYDFLFPELRQMPRVAVNELRAPKPHQKPATRVSWNLGPRSSGSGF